MEENTRGVNKLLIKAPALTTGTLMKMSVKHNIHDSETRVWNVKKHYVFIKSIKVFYKTKEVCFSSCSAPFTLTKWIQIQNTY